MHEHESGRRVRRILQRNPMVVGAAVLLFSAIYIIGHSGLREQQVQKPEPTTPTITPTSVQFNHEQARKAMIWDFTRPIPTRSPNPLPDHK